MRKPNLTALAVAATLPLTSQAASTTELQQEIEALKKQNTVIMERLDATLSQLEQSTGDHGSRGKTTVGGYGELHYNNLDGEGSATDKSEIDFHRFVLFFGHEFSDDIRFFSEFELEHSIAGEGKNGEAELEQAYIEFDLNDRHRARGGLFLVPVGFINETHEPPTFYGVERNPVEKNIVPATWWEAGAGLSGELAPGWHYDLALTSGLNLSVNDKVRDGRQKVSKAKADSLMTSGRIKWTGVPGLEVAATLTWQDDYTQGLGTKNSARLLETHVAWQKGDFGLRALYATWDLEGKANGYDEQTGWYVEPSWRLNDKLGLFARYNQYDNQAGSGGPGNSEKQQTDIGLNWWPHPDVVIKADYQTQDNDNGNNQNGFNLGIGYQF